MRPGVDPLRLAGRRTGIGFGVSGILVRAVALILGAVLLIGAFMFSLLVFAVAAIAGILIFGYVWWKTREVRRQMRERPPGGNVIEGEAVRDDTPHDRNPP